MGQMLLAGCEWVAFYVCCKSDFHLERVRFDADFCSEMKMKLDKFYFEYLLPELLKSRNIDCIVKEYEEPAPQFFFLL